MDITLEVQVLPRVGHNDRSEAQLRKGDRLWESSVERSRGPTYRNRIQGVGGQGERARNREALVAKGLRRKFGGRAVKGGVLTRGDLALDLKGSRGISRGARSQQRS